MPDAKPRASHARRTTPRVREVAPIFNYEAERGLLGDVGRSWLMSGGDVRATYNGNLITPERSLSTDRLRLQSGPLSALNIRS